MSKMEPQIFNSEKLVVKRGGYAQYFIYLAIFITFGLINAILKIEPPVLYYVMMAVGVIAVMNMNYLQSKLFYKSVIVATKDGIWTSKLDFVAWDQIKDVRLEIINTYNFSSGHMIGNSLIELVIETKDERKSVFWANFLNMNYKQLHSILSDYWQAHNASKQ